ncbi:hypothetical protein PanWU01x14_319950 [Parasponia andersonii]|uniref:Uncharacterized protein n=1 Tax=Parasponia andersonii TaxID=3476 RepID=A0A2P5ALQ0_PARAD|nr:hypothetical protein PanWU01x14_319950 [Parasponia andersonii]
MGPVIEPKIYILVKLNKYKIYKMKLEKY